MAFYSQSSPVWSSSSIRPKLLLISLSAIFIFIFIFWSPLPNSCYSNRDTVVCQVAEKAKNHLHYKTHGVKGRYADLAHIKSKYAFATFLSSKENATVDDPYFIAVRTLTYQLLHANETRSRDHSIPFVVLCTDEVPEAQRARLRRDGAIVVEAETVTSNWAKTDVDRWQSVITKLRLWELTMFERIAQLDGDTILLAPLDGVFTAPAAQLQESLVNKGSDAIKQDEGHIPSTYSMASAPESKWEHKFPPTEANHDFPNFNYLNAGFFVFKPDLEMLDYYLRILNIPGRFDPKMPEQNLLNYAHRREGSMPWTDLSNSWNIHFPRLEDVEGGVKSIHDKWWGPMDARLGPIMQRWRWRMEGFFENQDAIKGA